jgi:hypothetical protein
MMKIQWNNMLYSIFCLFGFRIFGFISVLSWKLLGSIVALQIIFSKECKEINKLCTPIAMLLSENIESMGYIIWEG